jgi:tRNA threonylcarbamoyladenosine biosynthesis protein TsaB
VYWGCFSRSGDDPATLVGDERVGEPVAVALPAAWALDPPFAGAGTGFRAYPQLATLIPGAPASIHFLYPRAVEVAQLAVFEVAAGRVLGPEGALPVYLRDNVVQVPTPSH